MGLFKATDEELNVEESNFESLLKESILEDLDEFLDPNSREGPLLRVMNENCNAGIHAHCTGLADIGLTGTVRAAKRFSTDVVCRETEG